MQSPAKTNLKNIMAGAHYYLGKYCRNKRDFRNAIFHFRQVLKLSDDPARKADVEKMLSFLRKERDMSEEDRIRKSLFAGLRKKICDCLNPDSQDFRIYRDFFNRR
ncbi:MAG: tetratricopeptide repeat protein [Desulfobacterales bacterium]